MNLNLKIVKTMLKAMSYTDHDQLPDFQRVISKCNKNGLHQAVWAHRGDMVTDELLDDKTVIVLHIPRRGLWQFEAVMDLANNKLYIMMSQDNLDKRRKEYQLNGTSTHYVYSLLHLNSSQDTSEQLELLSKADDDEKQRIKDCERMLGEFADQIDEVIIESVTYVSGIAIKANLNLFDSQYNLIDSQNISNLLLDDNDITEETSLGDGKPNNNERNEPLVKLRKIKNE